MYDQNNVDRDSSSPEASSPRRSGFSYLLRELLNVALIAIFIVLPIRVFIAQPFIVSGSSMDPTFENGDYLIVDQISYRLNEPQRYDVVIFRYPRNPSKFFIKRIIGLPEEKVTLNGQTVTIFNDENPDGLIINEPYLENEHYEPFSVTLGGDEYFVLGDNREASSDSRIWGPLDRHFIIGKAFLRILPIRDAALHPGRYSTEE